MITIKVLFAVRPDLFDLQAGDTVQINSLKSSLKKQGVEVEITRDIKNIDMAGFDLVHSFNILRADICLAQCRYFKNYDIPIILTPIYWNLSEYLSNTSPERLIWWKSEQKRRQEIMKIVDYLAPNGEKEYLILKNDFNFNLPYSIIYNGVKKSFYNKNSLQKRKYILAVGRIHPRKNQLNMIKAVKDLNLPVLFIGKVNDRQYYRKCLETAKGSKIEFLGEISSCRLKNYYNKSRLHMMVSWYDTPGLVNLEAGLAGCNLILTNRGTTQEYFGEFALYSSPRDIEDIKMKVNQAYNFNPNKELQNLIMHKYSWEHIALTLKELYLNLI